MGLRGDIGLLSDCEYLRQALWFGGYMYMVRQDEKRDGGTLWWQASLAFDSAVGGQRTTEKTSPAFDRAAQQELWTRCRAGREILMRDLQSCAHRCCIEEVCFCVPRAAMYSLLMMAISRLRMGMILNQYRKKIGRRLLALLGGQSSVLRSCPSGCNDGLKSADREEKEKGRTKV